jgi:hypothetical protein
LNRWEFTTQSLPQDVCFVEVRPPAFPIPGALPQGSLSCTQPTMALEIHFLPLQGFDHDGLDLHRFLPLRPASLWCLVLYHFRLDHNSCTFITQDSCFIGAWPPAIVALGALPQGPPLTCLSLQAWTPLCFHHPGCNIGTRMT